MSPDFLEFLKDQLHGLGHVTTRRMFSGAGIYCDGVIFALVLGDTLYFKVDDGNRHAYEAEGLEPFTYEAKGRSVSVGAYRRVPERLFDEPDEMLDWARAAVAAGRRAAMGKATRKVKSKTNKRKQKP
ncbi:MAG: TfoX/Sxy family protein [Hyphomicrobiaceae bacterium]|nr:MAG: TfoX/Sxy family protein [Hyphomicrobiaceae bacterium]